MKIPTTLISIILFVIMTGCGAASGGDSSRSPDTHPDTSVISVGRADAERLRQASGNESQVIAILLDIRAKESLMRKHSLDATADLYIATVEEAVNLPE